MASPATSVFIKNTAPKRNAFALSKISDSLLADESIKWQHKVPVGIRFNPSDQVLVAHYLAARVNGCTDGPIFPLIKEVDVFLYEPSQLPGLSYDFGHEKMYFFIPLNKMSKKEMNADRRVPGGVWKKIGEPCYVKGNDGRPIATKMTLEYYKNDQISQQTQWLMNEYMLDNEESWRLCVVYYSREQRGSKKMSDDDEESDFSCDYSSEDSTSDSEKHDDN